MSNHPQYKEFPISTHEFAKETYVITDIAGMKQIFMEYVLKIHPELNEGQVRVELKWTDDGRLRGMELIKTKYE